MRVQPDRRSALLLLALALLGTGARLVLGERGAPGAVAYRGAAPRGAPAPASDSSARDSLVARALRLARPLAVGERIDVDRASVEELARLPRVGPGLAARIVADRDQRGPFGSMNALTQRVSGVGQSLRDAITPHVDFTGQPVGVAPVQVQLQPGERLLVGADDPPAAPSKASRRTAPVPVNTATAEELGKLPGVSPRLAAQIVADRAAHGPFGSLKELARVPGLSPSLLKRLQHRLKLP